MRLRRCYSIVAIVIDNHGSTFGHFSRIIGLVFCWITGTCTKSKDLALFPFKNVAFNYKHPINFYLTFRWMRTKNPVLFLLKGGFPPTCIGNLITISERRNQKTRCWYDPKEDQYGYGDIYNPSQGWTMTCYTIHNYISFLALRIFQIMIGITSIIITRATVDARPESLPLNIQSNIRFANTWVPH